MEVDYSKLTWQLTDGSTHQYCRKVGEGVYQFKEFDRENYSINTDDYDSEEQFIEAVFDNPEFWVEDTIVLDNYTTDELEGFVSGYYDSLAHLYKEYEAEVAQMVIAECIFEQISELY